MVRGNAVKAPDEYELRRHQKQLLRIMDTYWARKWGQATTLSQFADITVNTWLNPATEPSVMLVRHPRGALKINRKAIYESGLPTVFLSMNAIAQSDSFNLQHDVRHLASDIYKRSCNRAQICGISGPGYSGLLVRLSSLRRVASWFLQRLQTQRANVPFKVATVDSRGSTAIPTTLLVRAIYLPFGATWWRKLPSSCIWRAACVLCGTFTYSGWSIRNGADMLSMIVEYRQWLSASTYASTSGVDWRGAYQRWWCPYGVCH